MAEGPNTSMPPKRLKLDARALARSIFEADYPEQYIRSIPPQSLFLAVKCQGLASSAEILNIATIEQCRLLLDFDCWHKDSFHEDNFWDWLSICEQDEEHQLLRKLLNSVDLKIVALLIARHVDTLVFEEPTDNPPAKGYFSPDKGYTWTAVKLEDQTRHFLFSKFLALLFETNADLFYQLLATPKVATPSGLEEESYQDKSKRLSSEGVPDADTAAEINSPLKPESLALEIDQPTIRAKASGIQSISPLVYGGVSLQPLFMLWEKCGDLEALECEITRILNAAIMHWTSDFSDYTAIQRMTEKVKGAINIGLETLVKTSNASADAIYERLGLEAVYRCGLHELFSLRRQARSLLNSMPQADAALLAVLDAASQPFPEMANFLDPAGCQQEISHPAIADMPGENSKLSASEIKLSGGSRPILSLAELEMVRGAIGDYSKNAGEFQGFSTGK